jgi:MYXO-CTERM domain-containing protein
MTIGMKLTAVMSTLALLAVGAASVGEARAESQAQAEREEGETLRPSQIVRKKIAIDASMAELISPDAVANESAVNSRIIYLNNCKPNGCTVRSGGEDSRQDLSGIISGIRTISAFAYSDAIWDQVVQCVRETFAPFNLTITDQDPCNGQTSGCTVNHWEDIVAGRPQEAGFDSNVGGVSPWSRNCQLPIINNSITYSFANLYGPDVVSICWTVSQEVAHSWGLDHQYLREDPMTYLEGSSLPGGFKRFQNQNAQCGEYSARSCQCGGSTQNSVQKILGIFGAAGPTPPEVSFDDLTNGEQVEPGFIVRTTIVDDNGITSATLTVDNQAVQTLTTPPYVFNAPGSLGEGTHRVTVTAVDSLGTSGSASVDVNIGPPCETPADCAGQGENYTCVGGRCVPGEGAPGGLGEACMDNSECYSGQCATAGEDRYCVEPCEVGGSDCPSGFQCLDAGGTGVCWPGGGDDTSGGCSSSSGDGAMTSSLALGALLGVLFAGRRRRARTC